MKKILFVYPSMIIGGSTTALLSLINNLDRDKYEIDLQLYRNSGPLINQIPNDINLLEQADINTGLWGRIVKIFKLFISGYFFKALIYGIKGKGKKLFSEGLLHDFQAKCLSRKNSKHYDYAIGFLEGWSDRYVAFAVNATKKYAWLHSTFSNITQNPKEEFFWMNKVDKIIFVSKKCEADFNKTVVGYSDKTLTIDNIIDSSIIKKRALQFDQNDKMLSFFASTQAFKILTVCRITIEVKGLDRIITCAKELKLQGYEFVWCVVGDGEDMQLFKQMIADNGLEKCVYAVGKRINPYSYIRCTDIMCMPSRVEGKPVTITEAQILGTPCVVTEYLSARTQIEDGVDGIVVENSDTSIITPIKQLMDNSNFYNSLKRVVGTREYGNKKYINEIENTIFI